VLADGQWSALGPVLFAFADLFQNALVLDNFSKLFNINPRFLCIS
jgi:hypothetical protein